jgi:hypothetical protein
MRVLGGLRWLFIVDTIMTSNQSAFFCFAARLDSAQFISQI